MALPENILSDEPVAAVMLDPDGRVRTSLLVDYEMGGVALGDPSEGLMVQVWEARVSAGVIQTRPDGVGSWNNVTSDSSITEIALAFDQNMRPTVAYIAGGTAKLYWYDATAAAYTTTSYASATSPVVTMDDKRPMEVGLNDVLLFYLKTGRVMHRRQRDRYTIEYDLAAIPSGMDRIVRWGFTEANRVQLEFGTGLGGETEAGALGAFYTDLLADELYAVDGTAVKPFFSTGRRTGTWKSKKVVLATHPSFAWLRVNGPGTIDHVVRIYSDGALWHTETLTSKEPVRLPSRRGKVWELEVEGDSNLTTLGLASSAEELRDPEER